MIQLILISTIIVVAIATVLCIADYLHRLYVCRPFIRKLTWLYSNMDDIVYDDAKRCVERLLAADTYEDFQSALSRLLWGCLLHGYASSKNEKVTETMADLVSMSINRRQFKLIKKYKHNCGRCTPDYVS